MVRRLPPPLIAITPGTLQRGHLGAADAAVESFVLAARAAVAGGVRGLLVREPSLEDGAFLELALRLREVLDGPDDRGWLGVHDRLHLACHSRADGVHVGGRSLGPAAARSVVGAATTIGVSTHTGDDAAIWSGADLALHAPVFRPRSKTGDREHVGALGLRDFVGTCPLPVWALGGISAARIIELEDCGAAGAATIGALWGTDEAPIERDGGALRDLEGIEARARALVEASERTFAGAAR